MSAGDHKHLDTLAFQPPDELHLSECQFSTKTFVDLCCNYKSVRCLFCCDKVTYEKGLSLLISIEPGGIEAHMEVRWVFDLVGGKKGHV